MGTGIHERLESVVRQNTVSSPFAFPYTEAMLRTHMQTMHNVSRVVRVQQNVQTHVHQIYSLQRSLLRYYKHSEVARGKRALRT